MQLIQEKKTFQGGQARQFVTLNYIIYMSLSYLFALIHLSAQHAEYTKIN